MSKRVQRQRAAKRRERNRRREGALAIIARASELLSQEENWTRGAWARDPEGRPVAPWDPEATAFSLSGALVRAADDVFGSRAGLEQGVWPRELGAAFDELLRTFAGFLKEAGVPVIQAGPVWLLGTGLAQGSLSGGEFVRQASEYPVLDYADFVVLLELTIVRLRDWSVSDSGGLGEQSAVAA